MTATWNVLKAWLVTVSVAGLLGVLGYVIGGAVARLTMRTIDRGERALDGMSPEQALAGGFGAGEVACSGKGPGQTERRKRMQL